MAARKKQGSEPFAYQPFKDLKNVLDRTRQGIPAPPATPKNSEPLSDEEIFRNAMKEVREIKEFRELPVPRTTTIPRCKSTTSDAEALKSLEEIANGYRPLNLPDTQEYVEWINEEYHSEVVRKLHKGDFAIQDSLDLHGLIVEEAEEEVDRFLRDALKRGLRCVKIIHGRGLRSPQGRPVLKESLLRWLQGRYKKNIIAFATARQCDGGLGALYILLR